MLETRVRDERNNFFRPYLASLLSRSFLSVVRFSSRAAFRVFGRALNWAPFKTWELFNAPPLRVTPPPFVISPLCLSHSLSHVLRDSNYERAQRKMSRRRQYVMIIHKVLTRFVTRDLPYVRSGMCAFIILSIIPRMFIMYYYLKRVKTLVIPSCIRV